MQVPPILRRLGALTILSVLCGVLCCRKPVAPLVAVIPETTAQELWESEHAGVALAARQYGWNIYWNAPSREGDVQRQIQIVNAVRLRKPTGVILSPIDAFALIYPVQTLLAAGIPVVVTGSQLGIAPAGGLSFVLNDEQETGKLIAEHLAPELKPGDTVAILGVNSAILALADRARAIRNALLQRAPDIQVIERKGELSGFEQPEESAEETIRSIPHLKVIIGLDIQQTRAAHFALVHTGMSGSIILIGCEQDLDLVRLLRAGKIDSIVAINSASMGAIALENIARYREGKSFPRVTATSPVLITRENVDTSEMQKILNMDWSIR